MGLGFELIDLLTQLRIDGVLRRHAAVMEIGTQQLSNNFLQAGKQLERLGELFGIFSPPSLPPPDPSYITHGQLEHLDSAAPLSRDFWMWLGFDYASIDIGGGPFSMALDLNYDTVPVQMQGKWDLVMNCGTTEHVANQLNAFKVVHDFTAYGGLMVHQVPAQGMFNHGLVNYNFKFFWMLSRSNGYKLIRSDFIPDQKLYGLPENIIHWLSSSNPAIQERTRDYRVADANILVVLQKSVDIPFVPPIDLPTGARIETEITKQRYWTVFEPDALDRLAAAKPRKPCRREPKGEKIQVVVSGESSVDVDPELYIGRGYQRLNDGLIDLAVEDLSTAINLVPEHGIALGLAAIAAIRANDPALQQKVIERYCSASKQLLFDLCEVGKWYSRPYESGPETNPEAERNRIIFNTFVGMLARLLREDRERLFWLGEGLHTAQLASVSSKVLARYCQKYPGHTDAEAMLINAIILTCDFEGSDGFWSGQLARLKQQLSSGEPISIDPFNLFLAGVDFEFFSRVCRRRSMDFLPTENAKVNPKLNHSHFRERIKLGFLLPYTWFASVNVTLRALLPEFDRTRFEIHGYALNTAVTPDDFETEYRKLFDRFVALDGLEPKAAARCIEADAVDVALDVSGHNRTTCLPILAYRPAPIQAHLIGWATIIEAPYIDYLITDAHYHPQHLRDMTTETYALMRESSWVYPPVDVSQAEEDYLFTPGPFRFCSFNHLGKIDKETFSAWMEILRGTKDSVLALCHWNLGDAVRNMRSYAERVGVDPARLVFLPVVDRIKHLQRLKYMDLALDTLRLGGGVTTMDALWAGLPIVTACIKQNSLCPCRAAFGPMSLSEEIVSDVPSYVSRAIELRNDQRSLALLREKIVTRWSSSMAFDPVRYTAELQQLIEEMWSKHCRGERPTTFTLPSPYLVHWLS
jgi:hypothetical protein